MIERDDKLQQLKFFYDALLIKDASVLHHQLDVCRVACSLAKAMALSPKNRQLIRLVSLYHDIGKLGVPKKILFKASPLTIKEKEIIKRHPIIGAEMFKQCKSSLKITGTNMICEAILQHHEWYNGKGYPYGLKGKEINFLSRVVAVADAFSAMTTERIYCKARRPADAIDEIQKCSGTQFDPEVVEVLLEGEWWDYYKLCKMTVTEQYLDYQLDNQACNLFH